MNEVIVAMTKRLFDCCTDARKQAVSEAEYDAAQDALVLAYLLATQVKTTANIHGYTTLDLDGALDAAKKQL